LQRYKQMYRSYICENSSAPGIRTAASGTGPKKIPDIFKNFFCQKIGAQFLRPESEKSRQSDINSESYSSAKTRFFGLFGKNPVFREQKSLMFFFFDMLCGIVPATF
jgi:hypothetical protein